MTRVAKTDLHNSLNSGDYAAAAGGCLFTSRDEAVAHARELNSRRQSTHYRSAVSQTETGYWQVWAPGTLALSSVARAKAEIID